QTIRELPGQLLVAFEWRSISKLPQEPSAVLPLSQKSCTDPVVDGSGHDANRLCGLCLLPEHEERICAPPFGGSAELFHFLQDHGIQEQVVQQRGNVSRLLPNNLRAHVLQNSGAMFTRLEFGSYKVLHGLADTPHAGIPLARCAKQ